MKKLFNHTKRPDRNWEEDVQDGYDWDEEEYTGEDDGEEYYADEEEYPEETDGEEYYADEEEYTGEDDGEEYYADAEEYTGEEDVYKRQAERRRKREYAGNFCSFWQWREFYSRWCPCGRHRAAMGRRRIR